MPSAELALSWWLIDPRLTGSDVCALIVLTPYRRIREATQHRQLTGVRECIGDGSLEQPFEDLHVVHAAAREICIERRDGREQTVDVARPRLHGRVAPLLPILRDGEGPVHQVPDVRDELRRCAGGGTHVELGVLGRCVANRLGNAIREGGEGVAEEGGGGARSTGA